MNASEVANIVALAEEGFVLAAKLISNLRASGASTKTDAELLAQANANADEGIAIAKKEQGL